MGLLGEKAAAVAWEPRADSWAMLDGKPPCRVWIYAIDPIQQFGFIKQDDGRLVALPFAAFEPWEGEG